MEPAASIIEKLGGPSAVARMTGVHRTRVSNWMRPQEKGGTGGIIPHKYHRTLMERAADLGFELPLAAFIDPEAAAELR